MRIKLRSPDEISVGENLEVESQNSSNVPPPPVGKATAPPPPPSSAGKAHIPSPPSPSSDSSEQEGSVEGNKVIVKPPIVVRDFAVSWFEAISALRKLMEMGIFASMNQTIEEDVARKISKVKGFELEVKHRGEKADKPQSTKRS